MGAGKGKDYGNTKSKAGNFSDDIANLIKNYSRFSKRTSDNVQRKVFI